MIGLVFDVLLYPTRLMGIADWLTVVVAVVTAIYLSARIYDRFVNI